MNNKQILAITLIIIGLIMFIATTAYSMIEYNGNIGTSKEISTNCYDRYSNEIEGLVCKQEIIDKYDLYILIGTPLSIITIVLSLILLAFAPQEKVE